MAIDQSILDLILESVQDRYLSLDSELSRIKEKKFPSSGPYKLLDFIQKANSRIYDHINKIKNDKESLHGLTEEQIEISLYRHSELIPYLYVLLSFVKGAEVRDTPVSLIRPLKRLINSLIPNSEVIFLSSPILNYSFFELSEPIRGVFSTHFDDLLKEFPEYLMVISFPESETKNILLHCLIAHEIGHGLYRRNKLSYNLTKLIYDSINKKDFEKAISLFFSQIKEQQQKAKGQPSLFPTEIEFKEMITRNINDIIESWVEEISADFYGTCILGLAYYFSFIYFVTSCYYIDNHCCPK